MRLRDALSALAADPARFRALATPGFGDGLDAAELDPEVLATLVEHGVVERADDRVGPRLPVVLRRGRPYLMSLSPGGAGDPYTQDVWPETDALLARVAAAPPGTLLEVGTGSGAVAIEGALAGHVATGTDLFPETIALAAFNAALHDAPLELLRGHMLEPTRGRRFDLIVSAPHYGFEADLLRVEMLREGLTQLAPGGALFVVTFLEWERDRPALVDALLAPLAAGGAAVTVRPLPRGARSRWFRVPDDPGTGVPARHRFTVEIRPDGPAGLDLVMPGPAELEREIVVPLSRVAASRARLDAQTSGAWNRHPSATVTTAADLAALEALLDGCAAGSLIFEPPVPFMLVDGCRWGAARCVAAHGAIASASGGVRPCPHGADLGTIADTSAAFHARMRARVAAAEARRGCATCPAAKVCSRCAFPVAVADEAAYCALIVRHHEELPALHRTLKLIAAWHPAAVEAGSLRVKLAPGGPLVAARWRPDPAPPDDLAVLGGWIVASKSALVVVDGDAYLHLGHELETGPLELTLEGAELVELVIDGAPLATLHGYAEARGFGGGAADALIELVSRWVIA